MDDSSKANNQGNAPSSDTGEIYSGQPRSAYEDAVKASLEEGDQSTQTPFSQPFGTEQVEGGGQGNIPPDQPSDLQVAAPPPYVVDNRKKYLIFVLFALILFFLIYFGVRFLSSRRTSTSSSNGEKITLSYWGLWEEEEVMRPVIEEYKKSHENVTINYVRQDPKQYRERLQATIERGEGPDIFRFHNTWVPMILKNLTVVPKEIYSMEDFEKNFYKVVTNDLKVSDKYYGIPLEIDGLVLFYNDDILKGVNVAPPATWVEVQNAVAEITVRENEKIVTSAIALGTAENIEHFSDILGLMMLQNGTVLTKSLFSCVDTSSTSCAVEALTFYRKFAEEPNNTWDDTLENSIVAFAGGKVAMILAPSWQALTIKQLNPNLNFNTAPVPQLPCDKQPCPTVNWASYWVEGVSNKSKNQAAAWEFLKFLSQESTMQKLYSEQVKYRQLFGEPYSRSSMGKILSDNPYLSSLITSASTMQSFYLASRTNDGETGINTSLTTYLKDAVNSLSKGTSPETALKTADEGFKQVFSRFGISAPGQ